MSAWRSFNFTVLSVEDGSSDEPAPLDLIRDPRNAPMHEPSSSPRQSIQEA
jgi:hypothetical protein